MKRILLFAFVFVVLAVPMQAQYTDTIYNRYEHYYYSAWYDSCPNTVIYKLRGYASDPADGPMRGRYHAQEQYTPKKLALKGLTAMVLRHPEDVGGQTGYSPYRSIDTNWLAEYLHVWQQTDTGKVMLDSVRWDTAAPKLMVLPTNDTSDPYAYCELYEGYFKTPVLVNNTFFISGTGNSNDRTESGYSPWHKRAYYVCMVETHGYYGEVGRTSSYCPTLGPIRTIYYTNSWDLWPNDNMGWGLYLPIADLYDLSVATCDSAMGYVTGGGRVSEFVFDTITAVPNYGFRFTQWNDGNTDNPREVYVTQDTLLTACFVETEYYQLTAVPNNPLWGSVVGGGTYEELAGVNLTALPTDGNFEFVMWNDSITDNPRRVVVTQDTTFTAIFAPKDAGIESLPTDESLQLMPNPASGMVTVSCGQTAIHSIEVLNAAGQTLLRREVKACETAFHVTAWPKGAYMVLAHTANGTMTQKLVVK